MKTLLTFFCAICAICGFAQPVEMHLLAVPRSVSDAPITALTNVAGCILWMDADDCNAADGSQITLWTNRVDGADFRVSGGATPMISNTVEALNNKPGLYWSSQSQAALTNGPLSTIQFTNSCLSKTVAAVYWMKSTNFNGFIIDFEVGRFIPLVSRTNGWYDTNYHWFPGSACLGAAYTVWVMNSGANGYMYRNGTAIGNTAFTATPLGGLIGIGGRYASSTSTMIGILAELGIWDHALSDADRVKVQNYFATKYGL